MVKSYESNWVIRTFLFVPGHLRKMIVKASESEADCVALCLEDAVPPEEKDNARNEISRALKEELFKKKAVFVRINPIDSGLTLKDLEKAVST